MSSNSENRNSVYPVVYMYMVLFYTIIFLGLFICDIAVFTAVFMILDPAEGLKFADFDFLLWGMRSLGFLIGMVVMNIVMNIKVIKSDVEESFYGHALLKLCRVLTWGSVVITVLCYSCIFFIV